MTFADKVLALRKKSGLSQEDLSEKLGVSRQAVSRWEMGLALPDASNLLQLSKLFKVTTDYLINDEYSSDEDIPIVKAKETSLNREIKRVPAMINSTLIGMAIAVLLALLLFPLNVELPVFMIPIMVLPFPAFYYSVFCKELKSFKMICFLNAAALISFGSFVAFAAIPKKWWVNLLIYLFVSVFWTGIVCVLYSITSENSLSHIMTLTVSALLCFVGCIAYVHVNNKKVFPNK